MNSNETSANLADGSDAAKVILVVDDEPMVLRVCRRILDHDGYEVRTTENPQEALELLSDDHRIDLLICDVTMPEMTGGELVERAREARPGLGFLIISGHSDNERVRALVDDGHARFLDKPFMADDLLRMVAEILAA